MFVPSDNLGLWAVLPLAAMHSRTVPDLMEELVTSSIKTLHNWTTGSNQKQKDIPRVVRFEFIYVFNKALVTFLLKGHS